MKKKKKISQTFSIKLPIIFQSSPKNPSQVRVVYSNNNNNQQASNVRPCIGACRPSYLLQQQKQAEGNVRTRVYQNQRYADRVADVQDSTTASYPTSSQSPNLSSVKGADSNSGAQFSGSFGNGGSTVAPGEQRPAQFFVRGGSDSGLLYSGNLGNSRFSAGEQQRPNQFEIKEGDISGVQYSGNFGNNRFSVNGQNGQTAGPNQFSGSFGNGRFSVESQSGNTYRGPAESTAASGNYEAQFAGATSDVRGGNNPGVYYSGSFENGQLHAENAQASTILNGGFTGLPIQYADPEYR